MIDRSKAKWPLQKKKKPNGKWHFVLEGENKRRFCELYSLHTNKTLEDMFGVDAQTVGKLGKEQGLTKDKLAVKKEIIAKVRETRRQRGIEFPSKEYRERLRQQMKGEKNHLLRIKRNDPERFAEIVAKRTASLSKRYRTEKLRREYGLPQATSLRLAKLSPKARITRYDLLRHNYFADPDDITVLCYDSQTTRIAATEATAERRGLKIVAADEE